jgi:hypothetical protein
MAERGWTPSPGEPGTVGVRYVDAHATEAMRALGGVRGFRRVDLPSTDHAFTPVDAQERVSDVLTEHLLAHD